MGPRALTSRLNERIEIRAEPVDAALLSIGNPHAVQVVTDVESAPVTAQGPLIEHHPRFPGRVNAGYLQVLDRHRIPLPVRPRRAGEPLPCGPRACAAVVPGVLRGLPA